MTNVRLASLKDTQNAAEMLARAVHCGDVITVTGDLGAGKTCFAQFLIGALAPEPVEVTSPTFTLVQHYSVRTADGTPSEFYHLDLYRITHPSELVELGIEEMMGGICYIEWPERLGDTVLPVSLALCLTLEEDGGRKLTVLHAAPHVKDVFV